MFDSYYLTVRLLSGAQQVRYNSFIGPFSLETAARCCWRRADERAEAELKE